ncbi:hyaluronan-mediated motility receptor [Hoplias malabaricus]|uniref:hyaluronan-mediated motility receptor n=1 Tax=Hoplias malabaricus TaxID=27720 RepID=UPI0034620E2D
MRRFFGVNRDDYSQIQYLTAKCNRLAQEKAVLEREFVSSRERDRVLQVELERVSVQLRQKELSCQELHLKNEQLLETVKQQRELVQFLEQRVVSIAEESSRESALFSLQLEQVMSDMQQLQKTETQLQGLMEQLHQEAHHSATKAEGLEAELSKEAQVKAKQIEELERQLKSKSQEVEELQKENTALQQELSKEQDIHQRTVIELHQEDTGSVQKLRETAEQLEWLCEQQRNWMCCVKRFKDCLSDEKESLVLQVKRLQEELAELKKESSSEMIAVEENTPQHCDSWDMEAMVDLQVEADRWRLRYTELFSKLSPNLGKWREDGYLKPP